MGNNQELKLKCDIDVPLRNHVFKLSYSEVNYTT